MAAVLGAERYGVYALILAAVAIAETISSLGFRQIIIREIARDSKQTAAIFRMALPPLVVACFLTGIGLVCYFVFGSSVRDLRMVLLAIILLISQSVWALAEPMAFGRQEMHYTAVFGMVGSVVWLVLIYIVPTGSSALEVLLVAYTLSQLLRAALYIVTEWNRGYFRSREPSRSIPISTRDFLAQSLPLFGTSLLTIPVTQLPVLFLGVFSGVVQVGYYSVGNKFVAPISLLASTLVSSVYPVLAGDFVSDRSRYVSRCLKLFFGMAFIGMFAALTLGLFGRELIQALLGGGYEGAILPMGVQAWVVLNIGLHSMLGNMFLAANLERLMVKLSVFNAVLIGGANYLGAHMGALGLAVSSWIGLLIGFSFHWYFVATRAEVRAPTGSLLAAASLFAGLSFASFAVNSEPLGFRLLAYILLSAVIAMALKSCWRIDTSVIMAIVSRKKALDL